MAAVTAWNEMIVTSSGIGLDETVNAAHTNTNMYGQGLAPALRGSLPSSIPISITSSNQNLKIWTNDVGGSSASKVVSLPSGNNLDCRMIARWITDKIHADPPAANSACWKTMYVLWNHDAFEIRSGLAGGDSQLRVEQTTNDAAGTLGFTYTAGGGTQTTTITGNNIYRMYDNELSAENALSNTYVSGLLISGTCVIGGFDEYVVTAVNPNGGGGAIVSTHPSGTFPGTVTLGGIYNYHQNADIHMHVTASGGSAYMNGVKGTCPYMDWYMITDPTGSGIHTSLSGNIKLLYPNYPYPLPRGLWVKFSNHPFDTDEAWKITATGIDIGATNYIAGHSNRRLIWSSYRGDTNWTPQSTSSYGNFTNVGSHGAYMAFRTADPIRDGDTWRIKVPGPQVYRWDISSINLGNITVSTTSRVFCTTFNLIGGAVELTNVKFGLLDDGGMSQHNGTDTYFSWATVGEGQPAVDGSLLHEWRNEVNNTDLINARSYLYTYDADLTEVATADDSKTVGVGSFEGLMSDYIFNAIRLGSDESGAKTITYRAYFDYS